MEFAFLGAVASRYVLIFGCCHRAMVIQLGPEVSKSGLIHSRSPYLGAVDHVYELVFTLEIFRSGDIRIKYYYYVFLDCLLWFRSS